MSTVYGLHGSQTVEACDICLRRTQDENHNCQKGDQNFSVAAFARRPRVWSMLYGFTSNVNRVAHSAHTGSDAGHI
eukprot:1934847-Amphidinium_carterae.2